MKRVTLAFSLAAALRLVCAESTLSAAEGESAPGAEDPALGALLGEARAAELRLETRRALELYREADLLRPEDPIILRNIAEQLSDLTLEFGDEAEIRARTREALAYAQRAAALAPESLLHALTLAVCYGKLAVYSETRAKIRYSRLVKQEAERAVALDPANDWAHHVLGRWHHEVAGLGFATRLFVRVIYGGLPGASRARAVRHLERAVELAPGRVPHHLELGFAYLAADRGEDACRSFARGFALPSVERYDDPAKDRARPVWEKCEKSVSPARRLAPSGSD